MTTLSLEAVRAKLTAHIATHGWRTTAESWGVTVAYLRQVSRGDRTVGPAILKGLGLTRAYVSTPTSPSPERDR